MTDHLTIALDALDRVPSPLAWDDVTARPTDPAADEVLATPPPTRRRPDRRWLAVAAALALVAGIAALARPDGDGASVTTHDGPAGTTAPSTDPSTAATPSTTTSAPVPATDPVTATTQPSVGTSWRFGVEAWTGSEYLVWGSEAGASDGTGRADGWRHDPETGRLRTIPVAPIAPRDNSPGVWTGTELIVCCGRPQGPGPAYATANAAAFDPATERWRVLASPPIEAGNYGAGAVWTGDEVLALIQTGSEPGPTGIALFAYDPEADAWTERTAPPFGSRGAEAAWTGDELVYWDRTAPSQGDGGARYDPDTDVWTPLPELPGGGIEDGSIAFVDKTLVAWGLDAADDTRTIGYRWRPGTSEWRPMAAAPLPSIEAFVGTPGSQALGVASEQGVVVVQPPTGYESGAGGVVGTPPPLLTYDPSSDTWRELDAPSPGLFTEDFFVAGGYVFRPDRAAPVVTRLPA